jgi:hypothetical protein
VRSDRADGVVKVRGQADGGAHTGIMAS